MKNLALVINAQQAYVPSNENDFSEGIADFFRAVSGTYLPLLNMFESLERDGISCKISMVFSPVVCTMLADPVMQERYIEWLDRRITFGAAEVKRCAAQPELLEAVRFFLEKARQDKADFTEKYEQNLLKYFEFYASKGYIELLATTATSVFLPYFADLPEAVNAQVETGLYAHKHFFGQSASGFWLPYLAYSKGLEKNLRSYGVHYTILDSQSLVFSETEPEKGIFAPARFYNSLAIFARDSENQIKGDDSFVHRDVYCNVHRDVGFELSQEDLSAFEEPGSPRQATGFYYWNNSEKSDNSAFYRPSEAARQVLADAELFLNKKKARLDAAAQVITDCDVSLVCTYDSSDIGNRWFEGVMWLEAVIRKAPEMGINVAQLSDLLNVDYKLQKVKPYPSAAFGDGYGENFLDNSNSWMIRYVRKASERMIDLAERFPDDTGLKARILNLGARELFLAQSAQWADMIQSANDAEYAETFFKKCIIAFTMVFDSLGSNTVSTEWLTGLERNHSIFPWINYRIFSRKK